MFSGNGILSATSASDIPEGRIEGQRFRHRVDAHDEGDADYTNPFGRPFEIHRWLSYDYLLWHIRHQNIIIIGIIEANLHKGTCTHDRFRISNSSLICHAHKY